MKEVHRKRSDLGFDLLVATANIISREEDQRQRALSMRRKKPDRLPHDAYFVGRDELVAEVREQLKVEKGPKVLGLLGMGGVGKTTAAAAVYDDPSVREHFEHRICWVDVRPDGNKRLSTKDVTELQLKILQDLRPDLQGVVQPGSPEEGRNLIRSHLAGLQVLVVIDNMWKLEEQPLFAGDLEAESSRILVTTRDAGLLDKQHAKAIPLRGLDGKAAVDLLWKYAFPEDGVRPDIEESAVSEVVDACQGLPLCLRVVGSWIGSMEGFNTNEKWRWVAESIRNRKLMEASEEYVEEVLVPLRLSYEAALPKAQEAFVLLLAVWPRDLEKEMAISMLGLALNGDAVLANIWVDDLVRRSLLETYDDYHRWTKRTCYRAHDRLRDIALGIANKPREGSSYRRYVRWSGNGGDVEEVIHTEHLWVESSGHISTELSTRLGLISLGLLGCAVEAPFLSSATQLPFLKILHMEGIPPSAFSELPLMPALAVLCLQRQENLRLLPKGTTEMTNLVVLALNECYGLRALPERISSLVALRLLELNQCYSLRVLPSTMRHLTSLEILRLKGCEKLQALPETLGELRKMKELDLEECYHLKTLPDSISTWTALASLQLDWCLALESIPEQMGHLTGLTQLKMQFCKKLRRLPNNATWLQLLTSLNLSGCSQLQSLPESIVLLTNLRKLNLQSCSSLARLPTSLKEMTWLTGLEMQGCAKIEAQPEFATRQAFSLVGLSRLSLHIDALQGSKLSVSPGITSLQLIGSEGMTALPEGLKELRGICSLELSGTLIVEEISALTWLRRLDVRNSHAVDVLPGGIASMISLRTITVSDCRQMASLSAGIRELTTLEALEIQSCRRLTSLPDSITLLTALSELKLNNTGLSCLPHGIGQLSQLVCLNLDSCNLLASLPDCLTSLTRLENLSLESCKALERIPAGFGSSKAVVRVMGCSSLAQLPEGLKIDGDMSGCISLKSLPASLRMDVHRWLYICGCRSLLSLSEGLWGLTKLTRLLLNNCVSIRTLPIGISQLVSLDRLSLSGCTALTSLSDGVSTLRNLQWLELNRCFSSESLPPGITALSSLGRLNVKGCWRLQVQPEVLEALTGLTALSFCQGSQLGATMGGAQLLKRLNLLAIGMDRATQLPKWCLQEDGSSNILHLNRCESLAWMPCEIGNLLHLEKLSIESCTVLTQLPESVSLLTNLEDLWVDDCRSMTALADGIAELQMLTSLSCRRCTSLIALPDGITRLQGLESLDLSDCESLVELPLSIGTMQRLCTLTLDRCHSLTVLPEDVFFELSSLESLSLVGCKSLARLPHKIGPLQRLRKLDLSGCEVLGALPEGLSLLTALTLLRFDRCSQLTSVPVELTWELSSLKSLGIHVPDLGSLDAHASDWISSQLSLTCLWLSGEGDALQLPAGLEQLHSLYFDGCSTLTALPVCITELMRLEHLSLRDCRSMRTLPDELRDLGNLRTVNTSGCGALVRVPDAWQCFFRIARKSGFVAPSCKSCEISGKEHTFFVCKQCEQFVLCEDCQDAGSITPLGHDGSHKMQLCDKHGIIPDGVSATDTDGVCIIVNKLWPNFQPQSSVPQQANDPAIVQIVL